MVILESSNLVNIEVYIPNNGANRHYGSSWAMY